VKIADNALELWHIIEKIPYNTVDCVNIVSKETVNNDLQKVAGKSLVTKKSYLVISVGLEAGMPVNFWSIMLTETCTTPVLGI
jgi:hypothetical protein